MPVNVEAQRAAKRRYKARNRAKVRESERRRRRRVAGMNCRVCGVECEGELCRRHYRERRRVKMMLVERFWNQGKTAREIESMTGIKAAYVYKLVEKAKANGFPMRRDTRILR